jgi:Zn-dependent protease with chaperone function
MSPYKDQGTRNIRRLAIVLLIIMVSACATSRETPYVDPQNNPQLYRRVDRILTSSRQAIANYPIYRFQFAIIKEQNPNAWVNTGRGILVVTTGLLAMFDDNEVALILLHENAHIKYNHAAKNALLSDVTSTAFAIGGLFLPGAGYGNLLVNPLVTSGYSRSQELEADRDVTIQCRSLRLTPEHYVIALDKMRQYSASKGANSNSTGLFDTHPNLQYRIDAIRSVSGPPA